MCAKRREAIAELDTLVQSVFLDMFGDPVTNPMGWDTIDLPSIGEFKSGATPNKSNPAYWVGEIPWVSPKDMKTSHILDAIDHVGETAFAETSLKAVHPGHVLIVVRGMILAHSFPVAINRVTVGINQDMKAIKPVPAVEAEYLRVCLDQLKRMVLSKVSAAGHGTRRFDAHAMSRIDIPVPPREHQRKFVRFFETSGQQEGLLAHHLVEANNLFASLQSRAFQGEL